MYKELYEEARNSTAEALAREGERMKSEILRRCVSVVRETAQQGYDRAYVAYTNDPSKVYDPAVKEELVAMVREAFEPAGFQVCSSDMGIVIVWS